MSGLEPEQIQALTDLMQAVSITTPPLEETLRRSARLAEKDPVNYKIGGRKKRMRKMRGGGLCETNWKVKMAVDSAIVLGGIAASIVGTYAGYQALATFMTTFGLDKATIDSINAVYEIVKRSSSVAYQVGASIGSASASAIGSAVPPVASAVGSAVGSIATVGVKIGPFVALGRYTGTEQSALADLQSIYNSLNTQQAALSEYTGRITRSISEKQAQLQEKMDEIQTKITQSRTAAATTVSSISDTTYSGFTNVQRAICNTIDRIKDTSTNAQEAMMAALDPFYGLENIEITLGGKRTKKLKKSKKVKKVKKSKKTKKTKRRKTRKH